MSNANIPDKLQDHSLRLRAIEKAVLQLTRIADMAKDHDELLKGDGKNAGYFERLRELETVISSIEFWVRAFALAFLAQFAAVAVSMFVFLLKILPVFLKLTEGGR